MVKRVSSESKQTLSNLRRGDTLLLVHALLQPNVYIIVVCTIIAVQRIGDACDGQIRASSQARSIARVPRRAPRRAVIVPVCHGALCILGQGDEVVGETTNVVAEIEGSIGA